MALESVHREKKKLEFVIIQLQTQVENQKDLRQDL